MYLIKLDNNTLCTIINGWPKCIQKVSPFISFFGNFVNVWLIIFYYCRFVGSVHRIEKEKIRTTVFASKVPQDYYLEIRTFSLFRYVDVPDATSAKDLLEHAKSESPRMYSAYVIVEPGVLFEGESLADLVKETTGKITITDDNGGTDNHILKNFLNYLEFVSLICYMCFWGN